MKNENVTVAAPVLVNRTFVNPSVTVLRCSAQTVSLTREKKVIGTDKNGNPLVQTSKVYCLLISQDTIDCLKREGQLNN